MTVVRTPGAISGRYKDLGAGAYAPEVVTIPSPSVYVGRGKFFLSGSGKLSATSSNPNIRCLLINPAGSGRTVYEARVVLFCTATGYADIKVNPTAGIPVGAAKGVLNAVTSIQPAGNVASFYADTGAVGLTGGFDPGLDIAIPGGQRTGIDLPPLVVPAGSSLGVTLKLSNGVDGAFDVYWWED